MRQSIVLKNLPVQKVDIYTKKGQDAYGRGEARTEYRKDVICRFIERGVTYYSIMQKGPIVQGKAQAWFDGDVDVVKGMIVVVQSSRKEYMVVDVQKNRDVLKAKKVDHTKIILE
jgi:hypothetical protein